MDSSDVAEFIALQSQGVTTRPPATTPLGRGETSSTPALSDANIQAIAAAVHQQAAEQARIAARAQAQEQAFAAAAAAQEAQPRTQAPPAATIAQMAQARAQALTAAISQGQLLAGAGLPPLASTSLQPDVTHIMNSFAEIIANATATAATPDIPNNRVAVVFATTVKLLAPAGAPTVVAFVTDSLSSKAFDSVVDTEVLGNLVLVLKSIDQSKDTQAALKYLTQAGISAKPKSLKCTRCSSTSHTVDKCYAAIGGRNTFNRYNRQNGYSRDNDYRDDSLRSNYRDNRAYNPYRR